MRFDPQFESLYLSQVFSGSDYTFSTSRRLQVFSGAVGEVMGEYDFATLVSPFRRVSARTALLNTELEITATTRTISGYRLIDNTRSVPLVRFGSHTRVVTGAPAILRPGDLVVAINGLVSDAFASDILDVVIGAATASAYNLTTFTSSLYMGNPFAGGIQIAKGVEVEIIAGIHNEMWHNAAELAFDTPDLLHGIATHVAIDSDDVTIMAAPLSRPVQLTQGTTLRLPIGALQVGLF